MNNNILIGDLRPLHNYGAIATSTELIKLLQLRSDNKGDLGLLDSRSLFAEAPNTGWPPYQPPKLKEYSFYSKNTKKVSYRKILKAIKKTTNQKNTSLTKTGENPNNLFSKLPTNKAEMLAAIDEMHAGKLLTFESSELSKADHVWVNLEGSLVRHIHPSAYGYRPQARTFLLLAYYASKGLGKDVSIINHIFDPGNSTIEDMAKQVYENASRVWCRDPISVRNLHNLGINQASFIPDALFAHKVDPTLSKRFLDFLQPKKPIVAVGDSAAILYTKWDHTKFFTELFDEIQNRGFDVIFIDGGPMKEKRFRAMCEKRRVPIISLQNCGYEELASILGKCVTFISGRWHASILASLSGTPCIVFGTDSHKTRVLGEILEIKQPFFEISELPKSTKNILSSLTLVCEQGTKLRTQIETRCLHLKTLTKQYSI